MKFNIGDRVIVQLFNPFTLENIGADVFEVKKFMEDFTNEKNDGQEYYKLASCEISHAKDITFLPCGTNNMIKITEKMIFD